MRGLTRGLELIDQKPWSQEPWSVQSPHLRASAANAVTQHEAEGLRMGADMGCGWILESSAWDGTLICSGTEGEECFRREEGGKKREKKERRREAMNRRTTKPNHRLGAGSQEFSSHMWFFFGNNLTEHPTASLPKFPIFSNLVKLIPKINYHRGGSLTENLPWDWVEQVG